MQPRRVGFTAAGGLAAACRAVGDGTAQHQTDIAQLGEQGAVAGFEALQRSIEQGKVGLGFLG